MHEAASQSRAPLEGHNLALQGQTNRLRGAVGMVACGLILAVVIVKGSFPVWARAACFVPFFFAAHLALQGLLRTCPMHTHNKTRECGRGEVENVFREREVEASRRLARFVLLGSVVSAGAATAALLLLP